MYYYIISARGQTIGQNCLVGGRGIKDKGKLLGKETWREHY